MRMKLIHFLKKLRTKQKLSINLSLIDDLSCNIKIPAALKLLSDSTEEGGIKSRQNFNFLRIKRAQILFFLLLFYIR